jgi:hypothetical protein
LGKSSKEWKLMKRYEELKEREIDYEKIKNLIEHIFEEKIKLKNDIGKNFEIEGIDYDVLSEDLEFSRKYCENFGYNISIFYEKMFDRKFFIRFDKK